MKISKVAAATARRLFGLCQTPNGLDNAKLRTVFTRIAEEKPRDYRAILSALHRLVRLELARRKVVVQSAVELDAPSRQRVFSNLALQYGNAIEIEYQVSPALLGGLRIQVGDDVFDGSVQGRIDRLAKAF